MILLEDLISFKLGTFPINLLKEIRRKLEVLTFFIPISNRFVPRNLFSHKTYYAIFEKIFVHEINYKLI